ncbi:MAG: FecR domain-containing protein [Verrucomicrobiales bacterium]|nr:FecR domain-containing protein [Verrucomicrobiales bacterium]
MTWSEEQNELLLRHLNGQLGPDEETKVADLLRGNAGARAFLRAVAEQAVVVADVERINQHKPQPVKVVTPVFRPWKWAVAAAAAFVLMAAFVIATTPRRHAAKVSAILGPCQYIAADGKVRDEVKVGTVLRVGDTIRTLSSSAWVKLELNGGSLMTIAGRTQLRLLNVDGRRGFQLAYGNLWATVAQSVGGKAVSIQTPTATVEAKAAQFDVEAHSTTSIVRVNSGTANVVRLADGQAADIVADHQAVASISRKQPFAAARQPEPVNAWNCSMLAGRGAVFGKILPPTAEGRSRLGAGPLLTSKKTTIYAANFSVQCSGSPPVLIEGGSRVRIRGTTRTDSPVYFGITTQRIKGGFFGKYIAKIGAGALGQAGEPWWIEVPLSKFKPKTEHLPDLPIGMELTDIWVFSPEESAELEIHRVEFLPREVGQ